MTNFRTYFTRRALLPATFIATLPLAIAAQDATPPAPAGPAEPTTQTSRLETDLEGQEMSLADVVLLAFSQNLDIQLETIELRLREDDRDAAASIYDPVLGAEVSVTDGERPTSQQSGGQAFTGTVDQRTERYGASVTQLLPTGATAQLGLTSDRTRLRSSQRDNVTYNPNEAQRAFIRLTQPLLRNFGPNVTNAGIRVARRQEEAARSLYRQEIDDRLADTMDAYWDLVFAIRNLEVQQASLDAAEELARINQVRVDTGAAPRADLLQAQAQAAERRNAVIRARSQILTTQDRLLSILNWTGEAGSWDRPILPTDAPDHYDEDLAMEDPLFINTALERRQDFRAAELGVDIASIQRDVARWQRLPELNAFVEYSHSGLDDNRSDAFDDVTAAHYQEYSYGLEFRYPIPNRRARAEYRQSRTRQEQAEVGVRRAELLIVTQVRGATRSLRTALDSIEATTAQVRAAQETLDAEQRRLEVGASTTFNVLEFQENLARAQVAQVQALVEYQKGLIELERSTGNLLEAVGAELGLEFDLDERVADTAWRGEGG